MKISQVGLDLIKDFEGCELTAYQDIVGVWTVGYGSTGGDVCKGLTITQQEAENRLRRHLERTEAAIERMVDVPLTQGEFDALCSFCYNLGENALKTSTLLKKLNASDYDGAAEQFERWNKAGGKEVAGLTRRRQAERRLFEAT
jgi:lysozyme